MDCPTIYVMENLDEIWASLPAWKEGDDQSQRHTVDPQIQKETVAKCPFVDSITLDIRSGCKSVARDSR